MINDNVIIINYPGVTWRLVVNLYFLVLFCAVVDLLTFSLFYKDEFWAGNPALVFPRQARE